MEDRHFGSCREWRLSLAFAELRRFFLPDQLVPPDYGVYVGQDSFGRRYLLLGHGERCTIEPFCDPEGLAVIFKAGVESRMVILAKRQSVARVVAAVVRHSRSGSKFRESIEELSRKITVSGKGR